MTTAAWMPPETEPLPPRGGAQPPRRHVPLGVAAPAGARRPDALQLLTRLQRSLKPRRVLEVFARSLSDVLAHQGLFFSHPECQLASGRPSAYRCEFTLTLDGDTPGRLALHRDSPFADSELEHVEGLLGLLGYPLRNALAHQRVRRSAREDTLTGLLNRTALEQTLPREIALAQREGRRLSLLMLDVDHFKRLNDRHGHAAGDAALRRLAGVIERSIRRSDLAFRYGGEEFVLLLPNTSAAGAQRVGERVRDQLRLETGASPRLTVSTGIAQLTAADEGSTLLARADAALYAAKQAGRDRIETAGATVRTPPATGPVSGYALA